MENRDGAAKNRPIQPPTHHQLRFPTATPSIDPRESRQIHQKTIKEKRRRRQERSEKRSDKRFEKRSEKRRKSERRRKRDWTAGDE